MLALGLLTTGLISLNAQDQPKPKKDTVNMDTYAKPETYYAVEDEKGAAGKESGGFPVIAVVAGVVVVGGIAAFLALKKKK